MRYMDEMGNIYAITDRFAIIRNPDEARRVEQNLFQQLGLIIDPNNHDELNEIKNSSYHRMTFNKKLANALRLVVPTLIRSASKFILKRSNKEDLSKYYFYILVFIRAFLHCLDKYSGIREYLVRDVYRWNANPFAKENKQLFMQWQDPIWIAPKL